MLDSVCGAQILDALVLRPRDAAATPFPVGDEVRRRVQAGTTTPSSAAFDPAASTVFSGEGMTVTEPGSNEVTVPGVMSPSASTGCR